jgi:hypothetical protein
MGAVVEQGEEGVMNRKMFLALGLLLAGSILSPGARADQNNEETTVTFNSPVQIPGCVLQAGTYVFEPLDNILQGNIVRIYNADRSNFITAVMTFDALRQDPIDKTQFTFAERGMEQTPAILTWFYPGNTRGHEFVYPKPERQEFASCEYRIVVAEN